MVHWSSLTRAARWYIAIVVACGALALAAAVRELGFHRVPPGWWVLAGLAVLSGAITVQVPSVSARLSVSEAFVLTATILFGPADGTVIAALDAFIGSAWPRRRRNPWYRVAFNACATPLSLSAATWASGRLFGAEKLAVAHLHLPTILLPVAVLALLYFLVNTWLVAGAIALEQRLPATTLWKRSFLWLSLNYFSGASVAILLTAYTKQADLLSAIWIIIPLLVITHLTYKTAMRRVEDANQHLARVNRLYLSTVETLAMAIDAKDQITHGHIRRVQRYAVALAKALGVADEKHLKALEAAALLHDMGKLAVPDYILNKPGPLSSAEREKMKLHVNVGAEILSAIDFPYPVVPIVRHHHEAWDGSGYPAGLKGVEIPIGARILAVADCFDALTTDRPYRPRLSDTAALEVIRQHRGTLYDPIVVDALFKVHAELSQEEPSPSPAGGSAFDTIARAAAPGTAVEALGPFEEINASCEEMLTLFDISKSLTGSLSLEDAADVIARHIRRLVPSTACVFYVYEPEADVLRVAHAVGDTSGVFTGLHIPLGRRLSGWVAANRQTVVNSDPVLDLGEAARALQPPLRSSISTPLMAHNTLVGVLTLYSAHRNAFTEDHQRMLEAVAGQVGRVMKDTREAEGDRTRRLRDELTGLPNLERFRQLVSSLADVEGKLHAPCAILFLAVHGLDQVAASDDPVVRHRLLADIAAAARAGLRGADLLFQYREDQFLVLLARADESVARAVARRVETAIEHAVARAGSRGLHVSATTGLASTPADGVSAEALLSRARERALARLHPENGEPRGRVVH